MLLNSTYTALKHLQVTLSGTTCYITPPLEKSVPTHHQISSDILMSSGREVGYLYLTGGFVCLLDRRAGAGVISSGGLGTSDAGIVWLINCRNSL